MTANLTASGQVTELRGEVAELRLALGQLAAIVWPHVHAPHRRDCPELWAIAGEYRDRANARDEEKARRLAELDAQRQANPGRSERMSDRRFTPSEVEKILKGDQVLHVADREDFRKQREEEQRVAKVKREQEGMELADERYRRRLKKARRERAERIERRKGETELVDAMSAREYDEWKKNMPPPELAPHFKSGDMIALMDVETEDRKAAVEQREQRERDLGLPQLQRDHAAKVEAFRQERLAAEAAAEQAKVNARDWEREQLAELGDCPTLEQLEAVTA